MNTPYLNGPVLQSFSPCRVCLRRISRSWKKSSEHVLLSQLSNRLTSDPSSLFFSQSFGFFRLFVVFKFYSCWRNLRKGFCPLKFSNESPEVKIEIRKNGKRWKSSGSAKPLQEQGQGYRGKIDQNFQFL